ncbi:MAG: ornithine decarboxylase, partial [Rhodobacteraceae bacterium]|nr:ornithine decarboxylase [Paracoccaceae bacterium]
MSEGQKAADGGQSVSDYYSAAQLRADRWSALREATESLLVKGAEGRAGERLVAEAQRLFEALAPIEAYWAFPGPSAFDHLRRLLEHRNIEDLEFSVRRVARALTSGAYRRRTVPLGRDDAEAEEVDDDIALDARNLGKPY